MSTTELTSLEQELLQNLKSLYQEKQEPSRLVLSPLEMNYLRDLLETDDEEDYKLRSQAICNKVCNAIQFQDQTDSDLFVKFMRINLHYKTFHYEFAYAQQEGILINLTTPDYEITFITHSEEDLTRYLLLAHRPILHFCSQCGKPLEQGYHLIDDNQYICKDCLQFYLTATYDYENWRKRTLEDGKELFQVITEDGIIKDLPIVWKSSFLGELHE